MKQGWCDLPSDLLYEIDAELAYIEKVRIRAACVWWNSVLSKMPNHNLPQLPWLLQTNVNSEGRQSHALFNLCDKISYPLDLPQLEGKLLKGSMHGWLVTISMAQNDTTPASPDICLLDPLTGAEFQLPPRSTFPDVISYCQDKVGEEYCIIERCEEYSIIEENDELYDTDSDRVGEEYCIIERYDESSIVEEKDIYDTDSNHVHFWLTQRIITSSSCIENCVVAATYTGCKKVAWCKPGHEKWMHLDMFSHTGLKECVEDIIFSNNKLYVLFVEGCLFQVEFSDDLDPKITTIVGLKLPSEKVGLYKFVVECSDQSLKIVVRTIENTFQVHELDAGNSCWVHTNSTGNDMLFLGYNHSLAVPACQFPELTENRIYYADDDDMYERCSEGDALIGVYNFEDASMEKLDGFPNVKRSLRPQPIWVTPPSYT